MMTAEEATRRAHRYLARSDGDRDMKHILSALLHRAYVDIVLKPDWAAIEQAHQRGVSVVHPTTCSGCNRSIYYEDLRCKTCWQVVAVKERLL